MYIVTHVDSEGDGRKAVHLVTIYKPHTTPHKFSSNKAVDPVHVVNRSHYQGGSCVYDSVTSLEVQFLIR